MNKEYENYKAGREANSRGESVEKCPHATGSLDRAAWIAGWHDEEGLEDIGGKPMRSVQAMSFGTVLPPISPVSQAKPPAWLYALVAIGTTCFIIGTAVFS